MNQHCGGDFLLSSDQEIVRPFKASRIAQLHVERRNQILLVGPQGDFRQFAGHAIRSIGERDAWARLLLEEAASRTLRRFGCIRGSGARIRDRRGHGSSAVDGPCRDGDRSMRADDRPSCGETHEGAEAVKFHLGDAENTMMPDERFDAVVSRHLVWTLPDPEAALADWLHVLRPGRPGGDRRLRLGASWR